MTLDEVIIGIIAQKNECGMTNQQIADAAKVSKTTVDRMLRNDPTISPNAQTLMDVANAVGYQFASDAGQKDEIRALYEAQRIQFAAQYNRMLAMQQRWLRFTVTLCLVLVVVIIISLACDVSNLNIGWIRR